MSDRIGQQFGNYRLVRLLGYGAFAEVYLGEHLHLGSQAALKVLHAQLAGKEAEGFLGEAQTIARLVHPNIVRVFDFDVENNIPFLVEDYAPNGSLRQRYPKGIRLPLTIVSAYAKQLAGALQYAHDNKVIHRDIKPENMLLGQRGEILLCDFGISTISQSSHHQDPKDIAGTAVYMAPEQFQGNPRRASDQYSLGIVIYEWLSGDFPFHGTFTEIASQHLFATPTSLRQKVPTIPSEVEEVVLTALTKDPHQRFGSMQAFATALEQACQLNPPVFVVSAPIQSSASPIEGASHTASMPLVESESEAPRDHSEAPPTTRPPTTRPPTTLPPHLEKPPETVAPITSSSEHGATSTVSTPRHPIQQTRSRSPWRKLSVIFAIVGTLAIIGSLLFIVLPQRNTTTTFPNSCKGFSDRFQYNDLGGWTWLDPGNASTYSVDPTSKYLHIHSTGTVEEDLNPDVQTNPNANTNAPRLVQPIDGNFTIETEVDFTARPMGFQGAAIVIWLSRDNFLRLEVSAYEGQFYGVNFVHYDTSDPKGAFHDNGGKLIAVPPTVELRVKRTGSVFTAYWQQFNSGWATISTTFVLTSNQVLAGPLLMNTEAYPHKGQSPADAYFHYFHYVCNNP